MNIINIINQNFLRGYFRYACVGSIVVFSGDFGYFRHISKNSSWTLDSLENSRSRFRLSRLSCVSVVTSVCNVCAVLCGDCARVCTFVNVCVCGVGSSGGIRHTQNFFLSLSSSYRQLHYVSGSNLSTQKTVHFLISNIRSATFASNKFRISLEISVLLRHQLQTVYTNQNVYEEQAKQSRIPKR